MKLLSTISTRRNAASLMLALWVLVLASGLANACLLENAASAAHGPVAEVGNVSGPSAESNHKESTNPHGDDSSKAPCLKACDEGAQALQAHLGADPVDPRSAPLVSVIWSPISVTSKLRQITDSQLRWRDPPERIRYSRWTL